MTVTMLDLREELGADFADACEELAEARLHRQQKDTPERRSTVAECRRRIDAVLDFYLELGRR
jgi:hypothetical protein